MVKHAEHGQEPRKWSLSFQASWNYSWTSMYITAQITPNPTTSKTKVLGYTVDNTELITV